MSLRCFFISILFLINSFVFAQTQINNIDKQNLAIQGYDPVAYFINNKAIKGNAAIKFTHDGILYYFASQNNNVLFQKNPNKYIPQYGGWCAYAMGATGDKVEINPETFKIVDDKLYLFYNAYFNNTLNDWNKDEKNFKVKADNNWSNIIKK
jgi:YHS domain-containing protein